MKVDEAVTTHQAYVVKVTNKLIGAGDVVEGRFACATGSRPQDFIDAVKDMGQETDSIIGLIPGESCYGADNPLIPIVAAGFRLNAIVTFGAVSGSNQPGLSHFDIIARDFGVPLCTARRPMEYEHATNYRRTRVNDARWLEQNRLPELHGHLGRMSLVDQGGLTVCLEKMPDASLIA